MRRPFVAGNWKMNNTLAEARALMRELREQLSPQAAVDVAVCTPNTLLYPMGREIDATAIALGAQNCHFEPSGPSTGEVSPRRLTQPGGPYVIVPHIRRRAHSAAWGEREPRYVGPHYRFDDVVVDPTGVQDQPPIWVGGRTMRSLRRAVELGDAWVPFLLEPGEVAAMVDRGRELAAWGERDRPLDVALWPEPVLDPQTEPDRVAEQAQANLDAGATILNYRFASRSVAHHIEQMEALTTILDPTWSTPPG